MGGRGRKERERGRGVTRNFRVRERRETGMEKIAKAEDKRTCDSVAKVRTVHGGLAVVAGRLQRGLL